MCEFLQDKAMSVKQGAQSPPPPCRPIRLTGDRPALLLQKKQRLREVVHATIASKTALLQSQADLLPKRARQGQ
jgi:hypothetical protein